MHRNYHRYIYCESLLNAEYLIVVFFVLRNSTCFIDIECFYISKALTLIYQSVNQTFPKQFHLHHNSI